MPKSKEIITEVTREQYEQQIAEGFTDDEVLRPGKHVFKRGGFRERHPDFDSKKNKARINIFIDADVLHHFRSRAKKPNAAAYQTQINAELRAIMERDLGQEKEGIDKTATQLLENDDFLRSLLRKLREKDLIPS